MSNFDLHFLFSNSKKINEYFIILHWEEYIFSRWMSSFFPNWLPRPLSKWNKRENSCSLNQTDKWRINSMRYIHLVHYSEDAKYTRRTKTNHSVGKKAPCFNDVWGIINISWCCLGSIHLEENFFFQPEFSLDLINIFLSTRSFSQFNTWSIYGQETTFVFFCCLYSSDN